jgi:hypothetical protein
MNPGNIAALAAGAGFSGADLDTAVAIAMAESGGNPNEYNAETMAPGGTPPGKGSYGLWQIYLKKHPEFDSPNINLLDPQTNAHAAFDVYSREGFHAWTTYNTGVYTSFLPQPANVPLTLDASTGLPIDSGSSFRAGVSADVLPLGGPSFGTVLLWGAMGLFALWIFEEAM